jgi:hypothetical protein
MALLAWNRVSPETIIVQEEVSSVKSIPRNALAAQWWSSRSSYAHLHSFGAKWSIGWRTGTPSYETNCTPGRTVNSRVVSKKGTWASTRWNAIIQLLFLVLHKGTWASTRCNVVIHLLLLVLRNCRVITNKGTWASTRRNVSIQEVLCITVWHRILHCIIVSKRTSCLMRWSAIVWYLLCTMGHTVNCRVISKKCPRRLMLWNAIIQKLLCNPRHTVGCSIVSKGTSGLMWWKQWKFVVLPTDQCMINLKVVS